MSTTPLNYFQNIPPNPAGSQTGSTSGLQCGFGVTNGFVPQSNAALITITGTLANSAAGAAANIAGITMGAGNAPAAFAAASGIVGIPMQVVTVTGSAGVPLPFTMHAVVNALTIGVGYWIDMMLIANGFGTLQPNFIVITALGL